MSLNRGGSYIYFPEWIKNKKATINPKSNDGNCFQYLITVTLSHERIKRYLQRITRICPLIN